ncbi:MAG: bifunctional demethylmenaquinone methyltransferase/2-methoxy-6-polyprenyl-1,4-benzoquinol methylase UbiE [Candidatus Zixiibacteriota bacterium]
MHLINPNNHKNSEELSQENRKLFTAIAVRYDLLNHLLSWNIDRSWRKKLVECAGVKPGEKILDLCTGTGDIAIRFARTDGVGEITGIDFSGAMLRIAKRKIEKRGFDGRIRLLQGDALHLPFESGSFEIVSIGFGLRNLTDRKGGILEMVRILNDGGRLLILEFSPPQNTLFGWGYNVYLKTVIPILGGMISGSMKAYRYFSSSVAGFLQPEEVIELMRKAGLKNIQAKSLTGGIAYIYRGEKVRS